MVRKRIIAICLILSLLTGSLFFTSACKIPEALLGGTPHGNEEGIISSDGVKIPQKDLEAATVLSELPEGESLPVVGNRETLIKLLMERGALYDNSYMSNWRTDDAIIFEEAEMPVAEPVPEPAAAPDAPAAGGWDSGAALNTTAPAEQVDMDFDIPATNDSGTASFSETNEQVTGISEGDIVKTDGQYLYVMSLYDNKIRIIRADGSDLRVVSTIFYDDLWGNEFYLIGNSRLAIIGGEQVQIQPLPISDDQALSRIAPDYHYGWYGNSFTTLIIFDISDRNSPVELRRVSMDGWSVSTRVIGGIVYMVTNKHVWGIPMDQADTHLIMPYIRDTVDSAGFEPMDFARIHYVPGTDDTSYMLIGAINVFDDAPFEPTAYLGAGSNLYMSHNAMYITQYRWVQPAIAANSDDMIDVWLPGGMKTEIMRFAINETYINYTGKGLVDGSPINQYSMDEYNGYFRIATTDWNEGTYVTVLSTSTMQAVGRTEPLAPGEMMHSMRFMGDMGYVVTFLNVDPLFTIDLSDPYNPRMLGELKIPGFSQYLHPVGNGLLLGIGRDTQEIYTRDSNGVETVVGFQDSGMRATLFDVKNPYDPKEVDVLLLGEGWTEVSHNPRAFMNDPSRNQYGFIAESWNNTLGHSQVSAFILRVENERLSLASTLSPDLHYGSWGSRLCFIGNYLYFVHGAGVVVYDYNTFGTLNNFGF